MIALGRRTANGGSVVGIPNGEAGPAATAIGEACYAFWQRGDFLRNDELRANSFFCQRKECMPGDEGYACVHQGDWGNAVAMLDLISLMTLHQVPVGT